MEHKHFTYMMPENVYLKRDIAYNGGTVVLRPTTKMYIAELRGNVYLMKLMGDASKGMFKCQESIISKHQKAG